MVCAAARVGEHAHGSFDAGATAVRADNFLGAAEHELLEGMLAALTTEFVDRHENHPAGGSEPTAGRRLKETAVIEESTEAAATTG
jgi:hypothetical protein